MGPFERRRSNISRRQLSEPMTAWFWEGCSPEILHHIGEELGLYSLLRWKMIILPILTPTLIHFSLKGWENVLFKLRSERVKTYWISWSLEESHWDQWPLDVHIFLIILLSLVSLSRLTDKFDTDVNGRSTWLTDSMGAASKLSWTSY